MTGRLLEVCLLHWCYSYSQMVNWACWEMWKIWYVLRLRDSSVGYWFSSLLSLCCLRVNPVKVFSLKNVLEKMLSFALQLWHSTEKTAANSLDASLHGDTMCLSFRSVPSWNFLLANIKSYRLRAHSLRLLPSPPCPLLEQVQGPVCFLWYLMSYRLGFP